MQAPARAADLLPASLRSLAAGATSPESWARLRSYAQSQKSAEWSGWAYFLAGYQEFEGQRYSEAAQDLGQAAQSGFSLADYAAFYQASALGQSKLPQQAAATLQDFAVRFPRSRLRFKALEFRANALMEAQQPQQAVDALVANPETRKQPALDLLLAQALLQAHQPADAAVEFQNVYYNFPLSAPANAASESLPALREQLGIAYRDPDVGLRRTRAETLAKAGRYDDALKEFGALQKDEPTSAMLPYWQLGQAKCFLHLRRGADALQALATPYAPPDLEAQRLALLVQAHAQQSDAAAVTQDLAQLEATYALYPAYADALSAAGMFYYRQLNWQEAAREYRRLLDLFPQSDHLREDSWRLAWCDYLLGDPKTSDMINWYLRKFPDSARAPSALYWLGRIQEDQGSAAEARALYELLQKRFVHAYYATQAAPRLAALRSKPASPAQNDPAATPLASALVPVLPAPVIPQGLACVAITPTDAARPALVLRALNLKSLEEDFVKAAVAGDNPPPELRLLLAEIYREQNNAASALFSALRAAPAYPQVEFSDLPEEVWGLLYPRAYRSLIVSQARLHHLDPYLVMGLIRQESAFNPLALSISNARGLMQVLPETAAHSSRPSRTRLAGRRLYNPTYNVRVGCAYLAGLMKDFDNRPELAMAAYHAGDFRVKDWLSKSASRDPDKFLESIPIASTRTYVEAVLRDAEVFRQLSRGSPHFATCPQARPSAARATGAAHGTTKPTATPSRHAPAH
ncbi:MAG: transglycosylase SLT domain-containing protein [Terriglobia bacterium]